MKKIKVWNGGGIYHGKYEGYHINVAAYSQKHAIELINGHVPGGFLTVSFFRDHFSNCWGNYMDDITAIEPCIYLTKDGKERVQINLTTPKV